MSVASMIRRQGTLVSVLRGAELTAADGNRALGAWSTVATDVPLNIQDATDERVLKVFGAAVVVDAVGYADPDTIEEVDRLIVTAGPFVGEQYQVTKRIRHRQASRNDHDELGLQSTPEDLA